eukprot:scaffold9426_cov129-Skeletonema_menzelii.AAC.1
MAQHCFIFFNCSMAMGPTLIKLTDIVHLDDGLISIQRNRKNLLSALTSMAAFYSSDVTMVWCREDLCSWRRGHFSGSNRGGER